MVSMNKIVGALATASCLALASSAFAGQGTIGGFDIPGSATPSKGSPTAAKPKEKLAQVVVSQSAGSKVTTIAQAMNLVAPGGTILVRGGVYNENVNVTKPVAIIGALGDYGREPIIRASASAPCMSIAPASPVARVTIEKMIFEFDHTRAGAPCIDVAGGSVAVSDSAIIPRNADIPIQAAYGPLRPDMMQHIARPPRDDTPEARRRQKLEKYVSRHAKPVGAQNMGWDYVVGGTNLQYAAHTKTGATGGILSGPAAGVRVLAGEINLNNNTIIGARTAVQFVSQDRALVQGSLTNNVILGNGAGIVATGRLADLLLTRNTIKFNSGPGVDVDARDGFGEVKILANLIMGNETGIFLSEKVRAATVNSNLVAQNTGDAIQMSSGFFGAVAGNTFADNEGCTVQFFSAEQREFNRTFIKVVAGQDFEPGFNYAETNYALDNYEDAPITKKQRRKAKVDLATQLPACHGAL